MANIGKGAATGAALGSAISPGLGTVIGGIGGAAISAIGSFFGNKSNRKASGEAFERESKFAREERLAQQSWIEQMYEKNNAYNSPAAQMQRLKEKDVYAFVQLFSNDFMKIVKNMTITA